jgi:hypothetical protein
MSAFGIILLKTAVDGKRLDASENVTKLFACSREEAIENDPDKRVANYLPQSPAERWASFENYVSKGLTPPASAEEYAFNSQGGGYYTRVSTLTSVLMVQPGRAMRSTARAIRKDGSVVENVFTSSLVCTSDGRPDYVLSFVPLSTLRVIWPASATPSAPTSAKVKRARVN